MLEVCLLIALPGSALDLYEVMREVRSWGHALKEDWGLCLSLSASWLKSEWSAALTCSAMKC
jgi:hypothetical protein